MDANTLAYVMALLSIGITWIAFRNNFFGLKLIAGMWWIVMFIYLKTEPPATITEGSGLHSGILVICIGFALMIVLAGLGRGIQRTEKWEKGVTQTSEGFSLKLPSWLNGSEDTPEFNREKANAEKENYRLQLRQAYRTGEFSTKGRRR